LKNSGSAWLFIAATLFTSLVPLWADAVRYRYDAAGRLTGVHYEDGRSISYLYDGAGNLLRKTITVFADTDRDGMDDSWETTHFGNLTRNGAGDLDSDGLTDLAEFMAGTNPADPNSRLSITAREFTAGVSFTIEWSSVAGKSYRVQFNDTLLPSEWKDLDGDVSATAAVVSKVDQGVPASARRFYRVLLLQ
jgi:YD repeat-containing protein